jgi:hypothetical protein
MHHTFFKAGGEILRPSPVRLTAWLIVGLVLASASPAGAQFRFTTNNAALTITSYLGSGGHVEIPEATNGLPITGIGDHAFYGNSAVRRVIIPASVTVIGHNAFTACYGLTNLTVHLANLHYASTNDVLFDKLFTTLIQFPAGKAGDYTVPTSVTIIGNEAFYNCAGMTNLTLGENVAAIGDFACYLCFGLKTVSIPGSVTNIGRLAFFWSGLTNLTVAPANQHYASVGGVLFDKSMSRLIQYPGNQTGACTIPDNVTTIGEYAFANCAGLTAVTLGKLVASIGDSAFSQCSGLRSVALTDGVAEIGDAAFHSCVNLTNLTFGSGVTTIGAGAFAYCYQLSAANFPNSVNRLGAYAFNTCINLKELTLGTSVTNIGSYAFYSCQQLTRLTLPPGVMHVGYQALSQSGLTNILLPDSVTSFGDPPGDDGYTFAGCSSLASVTLPAHLTHIPPGMFAGCSSLEHIVIPQTVTNIATEAFDGCTALTSISIPKSVVRIEDAAFNTCFNLNAIYFLGDPPALGTAVFYDDFLLKVYYLPGATGWGLIFGGMPTALWNPQATAFSSVGGQFGFNLHGPANATIVVEATTNLIAPVWTPAATNVLSENGAHFFSDSQSANHERRFYRFRSP